MKTDPSVPSTGAAHAVVRNEIFHHREEILQRLRQVPGCEALKSLNIRAG